MPILKDREKKLELIDQMRGLTPAELSAKYWGLGYQFSMLSGCPRESNPSLAKKVLSELPRLDPSEMILDIGSGRQLFLSSLLAVNGCQPISNRIITTDITHIDGYNLKPRDKVPHVRLDAATLPFQDQSIGMITSNMAVDYIADKDRVDAEMFRVLKPGSSAFITLMRPSMFTKNLDPFIDRLDSVREIHDFLITKYLLDNQVLTNSTQHVRQRFLKAGFQIVDIDHRVEGNIDPADAPPAYNSWWEIQLKRPKLAA